jgi:hypothetical protein
LIAEDRLILLEAEAPQPDYDVHDGAYNARRPGPWATDAIFPPGVTGPLNRFAGEGALVSGRQASLASATVRWPARVPCTCKPN